MKNCVDKATKYQKPNMGIDEIASNEKYRKNEQFQNLTIF